MPTRKLAIGLAMVLLLAAPCAGAAQQPLRLVTALAYGTHLPGLGEPAARLAKLVAQLSGGTLELELKQPGDGTSPHEILDKVSKGSIDAGFSTANFWAARIPAAALFAGFPFGPEASGYVDWFFAGNGRKLYREMYRQAGQRVHVIPCAFGGGEMGGWFAKEVRTPDDLKTLRMRIFGLGGRVMARAGATTVLVPGGAIGNAFDKGEIDAAEFLTPSIDHRQRIQDHVKLLYVPGWHQPETVLELLINEDRWNSLNDRQQAIIDTACRSLLLNTLAESDQRKKEALTKFAAEGVRIETMPEEVLDALRAAWKKVAQGESSRDAFFALALADMDRFFAANSKPSVPVGQSPVR